MLKRSRKPAAADFNQIARRVVDQATGDSVTRSDAKEAA